MHFNSLFISPNSDNGNKQAIGMGWLFERCHPEFKHDKVHIGPCPSSVLMQLFVEAWLTT